MAGPSPTSSSATSVASAAPTRTGTTSGYKGYYTVQSSDSCQKIEDQFEVTFENLYKWNPTLGATAKHCEWDTRSVSRAVHSASGSDISHDRALYNTTNEGSWVCKYGALLSNARTPLAVCSTYDPMSDPESMSCTIRG